MIYNCLYDKCDYRAIYSLIEKGQPVNCVKHYVKGMFLVNLCEEKDCVIPAIASTKDELIPNKCFFHKTSGMITNIICSKCPGKAYYGFDAPINCFEHKEIGMKHLPICNICGLRAVLSYEEDGIPEKCENHREPDMFYNFLCDLCDGDAIYGYWDTHNNVPYKCENHKQDKTKTKKGEKTLSTRKHYCRICGNKADCRIKGQIKKTRCGKHATEGMLKGRHAESNFCAVGTCSTRATFTDGLYKYCVDHKPDEYYLDRKDLCITCDDKKTRGYYEDPITGKLYCYDHRGEEFISARQCTEGGCKTTAGYGYVTSEPLRCILHIEKGMICVVSPPCKGSQGGYQCHRRAIFGTTERLYCSYHKSPDMIDLEVARCYIVGCFEKAYYREKSGGHLYCKNHKSLNMIHITNKYCENCDRVASFGPKDTHKRTHCSLHKSPEMMDTKHTFCSYLDCEILASFGDISDGNLIFCKEHKRKGMINLKKISCLKCDKTANYNFPGTNCVLYCSDHKLNDMVHTPSSKCQECDKIPLFGIYKPIHCEEHIKSGEINLVYKKCKKEGCESIELLYPDNFCEYHTSFDKSPISKNKKESYIHRLLTSDNIDFISNSQISKECLRRPDFMFKSKGNFKIILEIDEHQHYGYVDEVERMDEIRRNLDIPLIFIRYNPDNYILEEKTLRGDQDERYKILKNFIDIYTSMETIDIDYLGIIKLYYNEFNKDNIELKIYKNFEEIKEKY